MNESDDDGIRLAKRVAALAGCSRREAELLIGRGAVRVDGAPATQPQMRVHEGQQIAIDAGVRPDPVKPVTLLLHKPAGAACDAALLLPERRSAGVQPDLPVHRSGQRCLAPLEDAASGLVVFTQVSGVARRLVEDADLLEHEFTLEVAGAVGDAALRALQQAGRASIASRGADTTGLRLVLKGARAGQVPALCESAGLPLRAWRRLRIGRVPLAGLAPGAWRLLRPDERF